jgi:hopanoid biosynthesis associated RND transporter like protein HpnN
MPRASAVPCRTARAITILVNGVCRRPWLVLAVCLLSVAAAAWLAATRLEYHTQRNDLVSAETDGQKRWNRYLDAFGDDDDLVVVIRGDDRERMKAAADCVAARLSARPDLFDRVFHQVDLRPLKPRSLLYLSTTEIAAINRRLDGMAPLLGPLAPVSWRALSTPALLAQANVALEAKAAGRALSAADRDLLDQLPAVLDAATATLRDPAGYTNPWALGNRRDPEAEALLTEPQYFFTPDGRLAMVLARPKKAVQSFTPAKEAAEAARRILADVRRDFPCLDFGLTGLPVLESDEMAASDEDSTRAAVFALFGVACLYFVVYRGLRYPILTVGTLVIGTAWALGWATLTVGHLNILSATFAVMIIGMGDYGVLWVARYDEERRLGRDRADALRETAVHAGPGILTAAVTTALAFFATMFADFKAVAELGWIAGCGVLFCAVACFTFLPAALTVAERFRPQPTPCLPTLVPFPDAGRPFLPALAGRPKIVVAVGAILPAAATVFATRVQYDPNLLNMQADGLDSVAWEEELIRHAAGATWDVLSIARDRDEALALKARYEQLPGVGRVVEAASLVPGDQDAKLPLLASIHRRLGGLPEHVPEPLPADPVQLRRLVDRAGPLAVNESALCTSLIGFQATLAEISDAVVAARLHAFDRRLAADLAADLRTLRAVSDPEPITLSDLPVAFRERYVGANGEYLVRAFATENLWEYATLERFTAAARLVDPEATGKAYRTVEGLRQMKAGFERAGVLALMVIVGVLWLDFRAARAVAFGLFPLAAGVVATLGVMGLCGVPLNPANLIALPLIVGVGVDNAVHVLHDYADKRSGTLYRLGAATGRGIMVAALTTVLGFGTLMLARHRGMAGLGLVLTLGVTCCMVAALVVLPAVLRLADARRLRRPTPALRPPTVRQAA